MRSEDGNPPSSKHIAQERTGEEEKEDSPNYSAPPGILPGMGGSGESWADMVEKSTGEQCPPQAMTQEGEDSLTVQVFPTCTLPSSPERSQSPRERVARIGKQPEELELRRARVLQKL